MRSELLDQLGPVSYTHLDVYKRQLLDRADSPWYPTARLFRQRTTGDWGPVVEDVAGELARLVATRVETGAPGLQPPPA